MRVADPEGSGGVTAGAKIVANPMVAIPPVWTPYTPDPMAFHRRLPGYEASQLLSAPAVARALGVGRLLIKCESTRFGLPSFKMLGASWATYRAVVERLGEAPAWAGIHELGERLRPLRPFALAAATDGNHGRAVARMARLLGFDARIFVPEDMSPARQEAIVGEGAALTVVDGGYDEAVARSAEEAGPRCLVISDTSWPGYDQVPRWVVEGYSTLYFEIDDDLAAAGAAPPDVVVVPLGVGALGAATVNHHCRDAATRPFMIGVEPSDAACVMASALAGSLTTLTEPQHSIMVGLNCGTPSEVAWPLVSAGLDALVAVDDEWAADAVRQLAALGVEAGETGAAALAGLRAFRERAAGGTLGERVGPASTVLVVCTEGATDPGAWRRILGVELVGG